MYFHLYFVSKIHHNEASTSTCTRTQFYEHKHAFIQKLVAGEISCVSKNSMYVTFHNIFAVAVVIACVSCGGKAPSLRYLISDTKKASVKAVHT